MPRLLETEEVKRQLVEHQRWTVEPETIEGRFSFDGFGQSIKFVTLLADEAEQMQHHPDIDIRYDTVVVTLATHSEGGVTQLDVELAIRADGAAEQVNGG
ncbi:4a-hydroxytetrahydrobiopterin dehydratase [Propionibacteriaceae bacterium Y2011]|uniref:4a-hydroxytetrahydrobiopterin dehydratase n=1 Tax=Microlunatus sp. Y2014 TaxID=3418488 RepID=UPI003B45FA09